MEFLEWYNEKILVKYKDKPLQIKYALEDKEIMVSEFKTPDAFVFIYEREIFLTLNDGKIVLYNSEGKMVSNFNDYKVYSKEMTNINNDMERSNLNKFYLSESKSKIFTVVKESLLND